MSARRPPYRPAFVHETPTTERDTALPTHEQHMRHALGLAARATGRTSPNPLVGSVVVADGRVVGEGWHRAAGERHAEVEALAAAGGAARGATLYATLEPCCHHGRTPPCTDAILAAGIRHVVYAHADPNPAAAGGAETLRRAGVEVTEGVEERAARALNRFFLHHVATARPFVVAKSAASLDGRVATRTGESRWITNAASRRRAHELRQAVDAILVGVGTVLADDPSLTVRLDAAALAPEAVRHPRPIVLDGRGRLPLDCALVARARESNLLVATTSAMPRAHRRALEARGCEVLALGDEAREATATATTKAVRGAAAGATGASGLPVTADAHDARRERARVPLAPLLERLGGRDVQSLLVEGGPTVHGAFLDAGLIDELWCFVAPLLVGGEGATSAIGGRGVARLADAARIDRPLVERLDGDVLIRGRVSRVASPSDASRIAADREIA